MCQSRGAIRPVPKSLDCPCRGCSPAQKSNSNPAPAGRSDKMQCLLRRAVFELRLGVVALLSKREVDGECPGCVIHRHELDVVMFSCNDAMSLITAVKMI